MIQRDVRQAITEALAHQIAVLLVGMPRVGRTSIADRVFEASDGFAARLDASKGRDRDEIGQIASSLGQGPREMVLIDNVDERSVEKIASLVRATASPRHTRFLLLPRHQSVVPKLMRELTGLVRTIELPPIQPNEAFAASEIMTEAHGLPTSDRPIEAQPETTDRWRQETHWLRGGFPDSLLAADDDASFHWRRDYIESLLADTQNEWGIGAADRLSEVVKRIAGGQGQPFDEDKCRSELGVDRSSIRRTRDMLVRIGLIRELPNWSRGHPALFVRDAGLFHAMAGIRTLDQLRAHKLYGHSWECFASEALIQMSGNGAVPYFYRDKENNEIDLILDFRTLGDRLFAIEFKANEDEVVRPGFAEACAKIEPTDKLLVHSGTSAGAGGAGADSLPLIAAISRIATHRPS